jgi:hypothetical protein
MQFQTTENAVYILELPLQSRTIFIVQDRMAQSLAIVSIVNMVYL